MKKFIKNYLSYINDNPQGYWFKAKLYGWGWTPVRWQGWLTIIIWIAVMVLNAYRIDSSSHSASDSLINFIPQTIILIFILLFICYKTGEKPHWQWGPPDKNKHE